MKNIVCLLLLGLMFSGLSGTPLCLWADEIVFVCRRNGVVGADDEICTVLPTGGRRRTLTKEPPGLIKEWPSWSPDRTQIAFASHAPSQLYLVDADGGNVVRLKKDYRGWRFAWSPDGRHIAYGGVGPWLAILDVRTGKETVLFVPVDEARDMAWSPDGHQLAFVNWKDWGLGRDIYLINVDGTGLRQLTHHPAHDLQPAWGPNGRQIAFHSRRNTERGGIFVMDADGNNVRELTAGGESYPSWSPDGKQLAFQGDLAGKVWVGVMDADGENLRLIAEGSSYPSWQSTFPGLSVHPVERFVSTWGRMKVAGGAR